MADFSGDIQNFQRYGIYVYKFDNVDNLTFNSSSTDFSQVYLSVPLQNIVYNNDKIKSFYNPNFVEFVPPPTTKVVNIDEIQQQAIALEEENSALKTKLEGLTNQLDASSQPADILATKQVILELRKSLGQGRVDSDFSDTFPYAPIRKETR